MDKPVSQRLFFALWPAPEVAQTIWRSAASLVPKGVGRRLPPQHIHLTLAFLGTISEQQEQCVCRAAAGVRGEGFTLQFDTAGHFPRPQVVWLGVNQLPLALQTLQTQLVSELTRQCGYEPEPRPFVPHLTLWRKVRRVELPATMPPIAWPVSRFVLARSRTLPTGAEYSIVQEWPLAAVQE
ncbi:MAG: RNA 2',3'-cyclic phosphodiesterase [Gammaproteobacteria bacterium]|nr:RNA 2',3'-cyclic phosphodiesterase [Gammaproteobacteria bacterium]